MRGEVKKWSGGKVEKLRDGGRGRQRTERFIIVKTYWRNNANPYPGKLTEVKTVRLSASERAWRDFVRACMAAKNERELASRILAESQLEEIVKYAEGKRS